MDHNALLARIDANTAAIASLGEKLERSIRRQNATLYLVVAGILGVLARALHWI